MKEYTINVYNVNTLETIDTFEAEFENVGDLCDFMDTELHNYDDTYTNLNYRYTTLDYKMNNQNTPKHYQGTIQPIDLINAQNLNFNLGNVVNTFWVSIMVSIVFKVLNNIFYSVSKFCAL